MAGKLNVVRENNGLTISYRWWSWSHLFLIVFAVVWNVMVVFFAATGAGFFIIIHALVGAFLAWFVVTRAFNGTVIRVTGSELRITHGPVPWPFARRHSLPARSLVQLYVDTSSVKVNNQPTYNLSAKLDSGSSVTLIRAEQDRQRLLDLERAIEAYLRITDDPSMNDGTGPFGGLDLDEFREKVKQFEPIKQWLPKAMQRRIEETQASIMENLEPDTDRPSRHERSSQVRDEPEVTIRMPRPGSRDGARPLPSPTHDFHYEPYLASPGDAFYWSDAGYRVVSKRQLDFNDGHTPTAVRLELAPATGGDKRYLYAQLERQRWAYFEERQLDELELNKLGFGMTVTDYPLRLRNGEDRYYPRDQQTGTRHGSGAPESIRQFIYFSTGATTQFRGLEPSGRNWEVYVQEVVDGGSFSLEKTFN